MTDKYLISMNQKQTEVEKETLKKFIDENNVSVHIESRQLCQNCKANCYGAIYYPLDGSGSLATCKCGNITTQDWDDIAGMIEACEEVQNMTMSQIKEIMYDDC